MSFLYDKTGKRKYLTIDERQAFLNAAKERRPEVYTFCATLAYTGARISEVLELVPERVDTVEEMIVIECLKKRRPGIIRAVPVPSSLLYELNKVHMILNQQKNSNANMQRIWPWSRTTGWKHVKSTMIAARVTGPHACPKALRHSFGISALQTGTPLNLVQRWLGHSSLATTAIYADAMGEEERAFAHRFWKTFDCTNG